MFITPFLIGLAGSLHCIGMCNPLVLAVSKNGKRAVYRNLAYNIGRIFTYGVLGSIVSFLGMGLSIAGMQQGLSIVAGLIILVIGFANIRVTTPLFVSRQAFKLIGFIRSKIQLSPVFMGMVNGLIPCGMTLVALGYCVTLEWPADGFMAMLFFGLGTMPAMFGVSSIIKKLVTTLNLSYHRIQTALLIISAVILIGRGVLGSTDHSNDDGIAVCGVNPGK